MRTGIFAPYILLCGQGELIDVDTAEERLAALYGKGVKVKIDRAFFEDNTPRPRTFLTRVLTNLKQARIQKLNDTFDRFIVDLLSYPQSMRQFCRISLRGMRSVDGAASGQRLEAAALRVHRRCTTIKGSTTSLCS